MSIYTILVGFVIASLFALVITPLVGRVSHRWGLVDRPDGRRKKQRQPIPLGGGLAVALATTVGSCVALALFPDLLRADQGHSLLGILPAAAVLMIVGIIDDSRTLTGVYKFAGQVLSVSLLVAAGFRFETLNIAGQELVLGSYAIPFSMFFCLGAINAFNLLDGADGLASSVGAIVCIALGIIAWQMQDMLSAVCCFAVVGALFGFLKYNWAPARIYLGDTGSMAIGLFVAAVSIDCAVKKHTVMALSVPIAICAIPILDVGAALIRRITTGQSVFTPDRGHLHHALLLRGWSASKTVAFVSLMTAITCTGAVVSFLTELEVYAIISSFGVVAALAGTRTYGHGELQLIAARVRSFVPRLRRQSKRQAQHGLGDAIHLQGSREWRNIWNALREAAPGYNLYGLRLNVNIPSLHESFFASWTREGERPSEPWRVQLPLISGTQVIGKVSILGDAARGQGIQEMLSILEFLEPLESEIDELVTSAPTHADGVPKKMGPTAPVRKRPKPVAVE